MLEHKGGFKASKACKAINNAVNSLRLQESGKYEATGLSESHMKALLKVLKGECWMCKHAKPYRIDGTSRYLMKCEYLKENGSVAAVRYVDCNHWELKTEEELKQIKR